MATTVRLPELGESVVEVGCRFETPVPLTVLGVECADDAGVAVAELVRRLADQQRPARERRSAPRVAYTEAITVDVEGRPQMRAFGRDLSRAGLSFFTTAALREGPITVSLPTGDGACLRLRATVTRCTRLIEGFHEVAAKFVTS